MAAPHRRPVTNPFANRGGPSSSRRVGYTDHRYGSNQNLQNRGRRGLSCSPLCCCICILTMFGVISVFFGFPSNQKYHYDDNDASSLLNAKNGFATADERRTTTIDQSIKQYSSYQPKKNEHPERSHDRSGDNDNNQESASAEEDQEDGFRNRNSSNEKITVGSQRSESEENELEEDEAHHVFQKIVEKRKDSEENNETGSEDNQMNISEDDNTGDYKKRTNGNENSNNDEEKMINNEHIVEGNDREEDHVFQKITEKRKNSEEEDDAESGDDQVDTSEDDTTGSHGKRINDNENSNEKNDDKMNDNEHIIVVEGNDGEDQDKKYHQNTDIELHVEYHDLDSNESQTVLSNGTSHGIYGDISTNETKINKLEAKEEVHKVKESKDNRVVSHQIYVDKDEEGMHKKHAHDKKGPYYILDVSNTSIVNEENTGEGNNTSTLIDIITESVNISNTTVSSIVEDDKDDDDKNLTSSTLVNQTVPINPTMSTNTIYHPSDNETEITSTETNVNEIRIIDTILNSSKYVNIDINSSTNNFTTSETLSLSNQTSLKDNVTEVENNALLSVHNSESTTTTATDASVITTTTNRMNETIIVIPEGNILKNHTSSRTEVKSNALSNGSLLNNQISEGRTNKATSSEVDEPITDEEKDVKNGNLRGSTTRR